MRSPISRECWPNADGWACSTDEETVIARHAARVIQSAARIRLWTAVIQLLAETMSHHLRIARPVSDLAGTTDMYCRGLGLSIVGNFENHGGFDGVMLGFAASNYHFEFTYCRTHPVAAAPTVEELAVFYIPGEPEWKAACASMLAAGFKQVSSFNPYWESQGRTFEDKDGYRVVLQQGEWSNVVPP
nr:VOC family protein [Variovorax sp. dw_954]